MYELNSQQIDSVNGGGILTGALLGLAVSGMAIGFGLTARPGGFASCVPCQRVPAPTSAHVPAPTSRPNC